MAAADHLFTGVRQRWLPLYQQLLAEAHAKFGDFEEHPTSGAIVWRRGTSFAEVRAKKDALVVGFSATEEHPEWHPARMQRLSAGRVSHTFEVTGEDRFAFLLEGIGAALALAKPAAPRRSAPGQGRYATVAEYIAEFPPEVQPVLEKMRATIRAAAPLATEKISWQMPTWHLKENLVHFAGFKNHIGFYPGAEAMVHFAREFAPYHTSKGAVQFPLSQPIPYALVDTVTRWRVAQVGVISK